MGHDSNSVHVFLEQCCPFRKLNIPFWKIVFILDGAGSQYKNYKAFSNLCHHKSEFGLDAEWNFFATFHGKSPCDGIGGTVKRNVDNASLRALENPVVTPVKMFD